MHDKSSPFPAPSPHLRAPRRWFACIEYAPGLKIELPYEDEDMAIAAGIAHLEREQSGTIKIGYYGFRSRVIVYSADELTALRAR